MSGNSQPFTLVPGSPSGGSGSPKRAPLDATLLFEARACIVQNLTPFYWFLPDVNQFVPPWTAPIIRLNGQQRVQILFQSPPGVAQVLTNPTVAGQYAVFTFVDDDIPPNAGYLGYSSFASSSRRYESVGPMTTGTASLTLTTAAPDGIEIRPYSTGIGLGTGVTITSLRPGELTPFKEGTVRVFVDNVLPNTRNTPSYTLNRYYPAGTVLTFTATADPNFYLFVAY